MSKPILNTAYSLGQGPLSTMYALPVIATRGPLSTDINYPLGQVWVNKTSGSQAVSILASVIANSATWVASGTSSGTFVGGITVGTSETFTNLSAGGMVTNNSGVVSSLPMANGQLLIGNGVGSAPVAALLTGGTGISIVPGAGTITINSTAAGGTWTAEVANFNAAAENGYVITAGSGSVTATLPTDNVLGDSIEIIYPSATAGDILVVTATANKLRMPGDATARTTFTWPDASFAGAPNPSVTVVCTTASATVPSWTITQVNGNPVGS